MEERPTHLMQLGLMLRVHHAADVSVEVERRLVAALADLLVAVAAHGAMASKGEDDEREDP